MSSEVLDSLARSFAAEHPEEAALVLSELPAPSAAAFIENCPPELAAAVALRMTAQEWAECIRCLPPDFVAEVSKRMPIEQVASALRRLSADERERFARAFSARTNRTIRALLRYDDGTAGSMMEPAVLAVPKRLTAAQARESIGRNPDHVRFYVYVVDDHERLVGVVDLRQLFKSDPSAPMEEIMVKDIHRLSARARRRAILEHPGWEHVHALPVVDEQNVLVGVLPHETVRHLANRRLLRYDPGSAAAALAELYWTGARRVAGELLDLGSRRRK